ncbi:hypothetical protein Q4R92_20115, partial [Morganella morganii]
CFIFYSSIVFICPSPNAKGQKAGAIFPIAKVEGQGVFATANFHFQKRKCKTRLHYWDIKTLSQ